MPYIKNRDRETFEPLLNELECATPSTPGELNYLITCIVNRYMQHNGVNYQHYNDVIGALEGAKLELYRRHVASYEDIKMHENGDVK